jgi:hypothetical protein
MFIRDWSEWGAAQALAAQRVKLPIGIIYRKAGPSYGELSGLDALPPLAEADIGAVDITPVLADFR